MNIAKHMEAVFVAALAFAGSASYVAEALPAAQAHTEAPLASNIGTASHMAVVVVSAKRMDPAAKLDALSAMRKASRSEG